MSRTALETVALFCLKKFQLKINKIMEFEQVLRKRHSVRKFKDKEIPEEIIRKILEFSNLSPSAGNLQARKVVLIKDKNTKEQIARASLNQDFISKAPVVFLICADIEESIEKYGKRGKELYSIQDATIFASYLQLAITSVGLSSCWVGALEEEEIKKILKLPENLRPITVIPVGYPDEKPYKTPRKSLNDIIHPLRCAGFSKEQNNKTEF